MSKLVPPNTATPTARGDGPDVGESEAPSPGPSAAQRLSIRRIPLELRKAAAVMAIALVMTSTFAAAYAVALGRPAPRQLPIGVVGPASVTAPIISGMQRGRREFDVRSYPSRQSAVAAIDRQTITATFPTPSISRHSFF